MRTVHLDSKKRIKAKPLLCAMKGPLYCGNNNIIRKVITRYFELVREHVLDGGEWDCNGAFAICIHKKEAKRRTGKKINIRHIGTRHDIVAYGPMVSQQKYALRPFPKMKRDLNEILFNTNKEYRYAPLS